MGFATSLYALLVSVCGIRWLVVLADESVVPGDAGERPLPTGSPGTPEERTPEEFHMKSRARRRTDENENRPQVEKCPLMRVIPGNR